MSNSMLVAPSQSSEGRQMGELRKLRLKVNVVGGGEVIFLNS